MSFVVAAYVLSIVMILGYALSIVVRSREVARATAAWSEAPNAMEGAGEDDDSDGPRSARGAEVQPVVRGPDDAR